MEAFSVKYIYENLVYLIKTVNLIPGQMGEFLSGTFLQFIAGYFIIRIFWKLNPLNICLIIESLLKFQENENMIRIDILSSSNRKLAYKFLSIISIFFWFVFIMHAFYLFDGALFFLLTDSPYNRYDVFVFFSSMSAIQLLCALNLKKIYITITKAMALSQSQDLG